MAILRTELQMRETAGPVHSEGKAKSPSASSPLPTKIHSSVCPWPSSWTFQTHAPNNGFNPKSPWMGFACPCFSATVCSKAVMDVGCVVLLQGASIPTDSIVHRFHTRCISPGPSRATQPTGIPGTLAVHLGLHGGQPAAPRALTGWSLSTCYIPSSFLASFS